MGTGIINPIHIAFLLVVVLMLFGAKRVPELGKSLGTGLRQFKDAVEGKAEGAPVAHIEPGSEQRRDGPPSVS